MARHYKGSIRLSLFFWFFVIAFIPLIIFTSLNYNFTSQSLMKSAKENLQYSSTRTKKFIGNWFSYRAKDIEYWAKNNSTVLFLETLNEAFTDSNKSLSSFSQTEYNFLIARDNENDIHNLYNTYDYVYDIFLIDKKGNILYTVAEEDDLGANLYGGNYKHTKFTKAFTQTLQDKKIHYSDLEEYAPSNNIVTSFITAPIINDNGIVIGVFAVQVKLNKLLDIFTQDKKENFSHYLVGIDGLLRTDIDSHHKALKTKINTEQFKLWYSEHGPDGIKNESMKEAVFLYKGPLLQRVLGLHDDIEFLGITWTLISEIDEKIVLHDIELMLQRTILFSIIAIFIIIIIAIFVSASIAKPLKKLARASYAVANGKRNVFLANPYNNEIGELTKSFNIMVKTLKKNEQDLNIKQNALDSHSIVAITDVGGNITYANDKFLEISGYSREELIGKNHRILNSHLEDANFWQEMYKTVNSGKIWRDEVCNINKAGSCYWVDTSILPVMDENEKITGYIALRTDITKRKLLENELIGAKEKAEESAMAKAEFLASMSHEIRTPMNGVLGMLSLLAHTKLDANQKHKLHIASTSAEALLTLINDILDFSKVEAGKMVIEEIDFNLLEELKNFEEAIAFRAREKGVEVILDVSSIKREIIKSDFGRIRQILTNLVGNAIKFTSQGSIHITATLDVLDKESARLKISVKDSGIGIPENKIAVLFDSFSQVDASTTRKYGGTGLGLAIVKKLCELMDGSVSVQSVLGEGSTFSFDIGVKLGKEVSETTNNKHSMLEKEKKVFDAKSNILLVEDNKTNQLVVDGLLENFGLECDIANNGVEALKMLNLKEKQYDLILMDCQMPEMDGYETSKNIRVGNAGDTNLHIPIVAMTANAMQGDKEKCYVSGMDDYLVKPINITTFEEKLYKWLLGDKNEHTKDLG